MKKKVSGQEYREGTEAYSGRFVTLSLVIVFDIHSSPAGKVNSPPTTGPMTPFIALIGSGRIYSLWLICVQGE